MTECIEDRFEFASGGSTRKVVAEFSGGTISSDGGGLLLQETDARMNLLARFSQCFIDGRNPIEHLPIDPHQRNRRNGVCENANGPVVQHRASDAEHDGKEQRPDSKVGMQTADPFGRFPDRDVTDNVWPRGASAPR